MQHPSSAATPSGADVAFADLICADTELLHAEFDAIIAATSRSAVAAQPTPTEANQASGRPPAPTASPATARHNRGRPGLERAEGRHPDAA